VQSVLDQIAPRLGPDKIVVQSSTISARWTLRSADQVRRTGASFLEAPFTGSKIAAEDRQTGYYLGGDAELVEKMRPVLDPISSAILDFGCYGANLCEKDFHIIRTGVSGHEPCEVAKAKRSLLRGLSLRGNEPTTRQ